MSVYYNYSPYSSKLVVLFNVDDCVYWHTYKELGKWFVYTPGEIFHVKLLGYAHRFMSISISQLKDHYVSVDQYRYVKSVVADYIYTVTINENLKCHKNALHHDIIFTKENSSTSGEQVELLYI